MVTSRKRNVEIQVLVDDKQARQNLKNIDKNTQQTAKGFGNIAGAAKVAAGAFIAQHAVEQFREVIDASSDLNESVNAVQKTFGPYGDEILKIGEKADEMFGLSQSAFNTFAVGFSSFADTIASKSNTSVVEVIDTLMGRVADFASVMNLDVPEAAEKFRSGLAGETEPLRQFGIDVSAAKVTQEGLKRGLGDTSGKLSEQEKILARYYLIMDQTNKTAGDFADTSDELANKQRILAAKFENTKASIGDALVPALEDAFEAAEPLIDVAKLLADSWGSFKDNNDKLLESKSPLENFLGGLVNLMTTGAIPSAFNMAKALFGARDASEEFADSVGEAQSPTSELSRGMDIARHSALKQRDAHEEAADAIRDQIEASEEAVDPLLKLVRSSQKLDDAQRRYTDALIKNGPKSDEAREAALELAEAQLEVNSAATVYASEGGPKSLEALKKLARQAGLDEDAVEDLILMIERLNRTPVGLGRIGRNITGRIGDNRTEFHSGGVVPGTPGSEVNATLLAGETVLPRGATSEGGGRGHGHRPRIRRLGSPTGRRNGPAANQTAET